MHARCTRDAGEMHGRCTRDAREMQGRHGGEEAMLSAQLTSLGWAGQLGATCGAAGARCSAGCLGLG